MADKHTVKSNAAHAALLVSIVSLGVSIVSAYFTRENLLLQSSQIEVNLVITCWPEPDPKERPTLHVYIENLGAPVSIERLGICMPTKQAIRILQTPSIWRIVTLPKRLERNDGMTIILGPKDLDRLSPGERGIVRSFAVRLASGQMIENGGSEFLDYIKACPQEHDRKFDPSDPP